MPCGATQDGGVMVESSDRMWSTGEGNGKPLQYSCLENPMNSVKMQKDRTLKDELLRSVGAQYATGEQWENNSKKEWSCQVASVVSDSVWPHRRQPTRFCCPWDSPDNNTGVGCHFLLQCVKVKRESKHSYVLNHVFYMYFIWLNLNTVKKMDL